MAVNTTRLGLLKKDPVVDGNDTFNIKTMLNDNWDALDTKVETITGAQAKADAARDAAISAAATDATSKANTAEANAKGASVPLTQKGVPGGVASYALGSSLSVKTGTISHGGTIPQTAGYTNYIYTVSPNQVQYGDTVSGGNSSGNYIYCSVNQSTRVVTCYTQHNNNVLYTLNGIANYLEIAW